MNPNTNKFEKLSEKLSPEKQLTALMDEAETKLKSLEEPRLLRPDGTPVPEHWSTFKVGENVVVNNYTFRVGYVGESTLLLEPVGPVVPLGPAERTEYLLKIVNGPAQGKERFFYEGEKILLGSGGETSRLLPGEFEPEGPWHAKLSAGGGGVQIEGLGKGVFVNGRKVTKGPLRERDRILVDSSTGTTFQFHKRT